MLRRFTLKVKNIVVMNLSFASRTHLKRTSLKFSIRARELRCCVTPSRLYIHVGAEVERVLGVNQIGLVRPVALSWCWVDRLEILALTPNGRNGPHNLRADSK